MDDYTSYGTSTDVDYAAPSVWAEFYETPRRSPQPKRATRSGTNALPEVVLTEEVSENERKRRTLAGIFAKFAADKEITRSTMYAAETFIEALPRNKDLPQVAPDGEGGLTLAWTVHGHGRTVIALADWMLYPVARAGTNQALYLNDAAFSGVIPDDVLALIPQ
jgi:hypothetical protein